MTFEDIPAGERLFIDSNTFAYHFTAHPVFGAACTSLLSDVHRNLISASLTTHLQSEIVHKTMVLEAIDKHSWSPSAVTKKLRKDPTRIQALNIFRTVPAEIRALKVQILPVSIAWIDAAILICDAYGLLTNDAITVAAKRPTASRPSPPTIPISTAFRASSATRPCNPSSFP